MLWGGMAASVAATGVDPASVVADAAADVGSRRRGRWGYVFGQRGVAGRGRHIRGDRVSDVDTSPDRDAPPAADAHVRVGRTVAPGNTATDNTVDIARIQDRCRGSGIIVPRLRAGLGR